MTVNTTVNAPPEFLQSYYKALAERGMNNGNLGFQSYGGQRVASMTPQQQQAAQMVQQRALSGSPEMTQASNWYSQMLNGGKDVGMINTGQPQTYGQSNNMGFGGAGNDGGRKSQPWNYGGGFVEGSGNYQRGAPDPVGGVMNQGSPRDAARINQQIGGYGIGTRLPQDQGGGGFNQYGDPEGTMYMGGSPTFDESTGSYKPYTGQNGTVTEGFNETEYSGTMALGPQSIQSGGQIGSVGQPGQIQGVNPSYGPSQITSGGTATGIDSPGQISAIQAALGPNQVNASRSIQDINAPGQIGSVNAALGPGQVADSGRIGPVSATYGAGSIASGGQSTAGRNAYLGMDNPYLNKAISQAQNDVTSRIDSKFNGNAFGGTAHQQTLARELGNVSNNMRMQDYASQQGLSESDVARQLANQQYNIGNQNALNLTNANLGFQNAGIANSAAQFNAGLEGQNIGNQNQVNALNAGLGWKGAEAQNQMGQFNAGLQGQNINNATDAAKFNAGLQGQNIGYENQVNALNAGLGWQGANAQNQTSQFNAGLQGQNINNATDAAKFNTGVQQYNIGNQNQLNQLNAGYGFQNAGIANQMGLANANLQGQNIGNQMTVNQQNAAIQGQNVGNANQLNQFNANLGFQNAGIQNATNQFNANTQAANIGRQQSALGFAPTLAANDYADASALMGIGNQMQSQNQSIADANYAEFMRQQNDPALKMSYMQQGLNPAGQVFQNAQTTQNTQGSPLAGAIGGGMAGYAAGSFFNNPWLGAGLGAAAGGLLSR